MSDLSIFRTSAQRLQLIPRIGIGSGRGAAIYHGAELFGRGRMLTANRLRSKPRRLINNLAIVLNRCAKSKSTAQDIAVAKTELYKLVSVPEVSGYISSSDFEILCANAASFPQVVRQFDIEAIEEGE